MRSLSPFGEIFELETDPGAENRKVAEFVAAAPGRPVAVIQGLGFVGAAMAAAVATAKRPDGSPWYTVLGVELADKANAWKIGRVNGGRPPVKSSDASMDAAYAESSKQNNLLATFSSQAYALADVVVVDVNLDIQKGGRARDYRFSFDPYLAAVGEVAENVREGVLVVVETTVPPGTTEKVLAPLFQDAFLKRGLDPDKLYLAHAYERVMPGPDYLASITDFFRVFAGINKESAEKAREFLSCITNTRDFPLSELHRPTASEMAKVLENSFRAANIAFIQEWTQLAQQAGVDLFSVIQAIRKRPTHQNIMAPGFGVGGYCLTKDGLLADWAGVNLLDNPGRLEMSLTSVEINDQMPLFALELVRRGLGDLTGKKISVLGVSYRDNVADTRSSPTAVFYDAARGLGAEVAVHDSLASHWPEKGREVETDLDIFAKTRKHDAVVLAVRHAEYLALDAPALLDLFPGVSVVVDANNVMDDKTAADLARTGVKVLGVGKGHWAELSGK